MIHKFSVEMELDTEQVNQLRDVVRRFNAVNGDHMTEEQMLGAFIYAGQNKWFSERVRDLSLGLDIMEEDYRNGNLEQDADNVLLIHLPDDVTAQEGDA